MGKQWKQWEALLSWARKSLQLVTAAMKLRHLLLGRKAMTDKGSILKSSNSTLPTKVHLAKAMVFPVWKLECEESWALKNWCFRTVVLEKALESPLDCQEIQPVSPKGNQPWIFIERTDAEAENPIPHLMWRTDSLEKTLMLGKKEMEVAEDEMVRKHHWLNRHESEQTLGDSERQGSLVCFSSWDFKGPDMTEWLNNNFLKFSSVMVMGAATVIVYCSIMRWIVTDHNKKKSKLG